jgi:transcription elongation factor GreA
VIDVTKLNNTGKVVFGTTVTLIDPKTERHVVYQIVGEDEADVKLGKISYTSPVARAMMGKEEADNIVVKAPSGDIAYEIDKVEYL